MKKVETGKLMKAAAAIKRLGRALSIFLLLPLAGSLLPPAVRAEVPVKFTYQGNLRQAGFLVNGQRSMVFRIYSSSTAAVELWTSPAYDVGVSTGVFRATLEPVLSDWQSGNLWLELEVEGNRMSPREELTSSPYSINSLMLSGKRYETAALAPVPAAPGDLWYDSTLNVINFWNGTAWTSAGGSDGPHALTHAGGGSDPILSLGAHTVTGPLLLQGTLNATSNLNVGGSGYTVTFASSVTAGWFRGNGAWLTNLNASRLTSGYISGDRIPNVIVSTHIVDGSILNQDLADGAVTKEKLAQSGCAEGDLLKLTSGLWVCASGSGIGAETDPLSIHNQETLQAGTTFYVSSGTVNDLTANTLKVMDVILRGTLNPSSDLQIGGAGYAVTFASSVTAGFFHGDGSMLTGIDGKDNLGNHIATTTLNMAGFDIVGVSTLTVSSITTTAAEVTFSTNVFISGNLGVGAENPAARLAVTGAENSGQYIAVFNSGSKLAAWLRNK